MKDKGTRQFKIQNMPNGHAARTEFRIRSLSLTQHFTAEHCLSIPSSQPKRDRDNVRNALVYF